MTRLTVLSVEEIEAIHQATLRILCNTGILMTEPKGLEILTEAGAVLAGSHQNLRVLLPADLVEKEVARCPASVSIRGRAGGTKVLGDGSLHWHNLGGARCVHNARDDQRQPATLQDVRDSTRLLDAMNSATTIVPMFTPQDVPGPLMSLAMYRNALPFTTKPLQGPGIQNAREVHYILRMAELMGPPHEVLSLSVSPVSPLTFPEEAVQAIVEIARQGIPFAPLPCPTAGATAPCSIAGALAQQNAEILAAIVLAQLVKPGLPIVYCGRLAMMEPRTGLSVWGGVELGLASAATVQVGHRYGLPVNVYGFSTNSHTLDLQNGFERAMNAAIPALAGADELSGIGEMEAGVTSSFTQIVCDNEIAASVHRLRRGFVVNEDSLAVDVIDAVLGGTRNFLGQRHTTKFLRSGEMLITHLAERRSWESWDREGKVGMVERAKAEAERLLVEHQVDPLDDIQEHELDAIFESARKELVKRN